MKPIATPEMPRPASTRIHANATDSPAASRPSSTLRRMFRVRSMMFESTRITVYCSTMRTIHVVAPRPG